MCQGNPSAAVIPITLWRKFFPENTHSSENIVEAIEDYCLNRAMDEAQTTLLLGREEALKFFGGRSRLKVKYRQLFLKDLKKAQKTAYLPSSLRSRLLHPLRKTRLKSAS